MPVLHDENVDIIFQLTAHAGRNTLWRMNCMVLTPGVICLDSQGREWEYVGKTLEHEYIFCRYYDEKVGPNLVRMSELMATHWNGVRRYHEGLKILKAKE